MFKGQEMGRSGPVPKNGTAAETWVIMLDMGNDERGFRRDVLGVRGYKEAAIAAIQVWVEGQNRELTQIWGPSLNGQMNKRLLTIRPDGLGAQNGFKDAHIWATSFGHDAALG